MDLGSWQPLRKAWSQALYSQGGFYTWARPVEHFRTSVHASPLFADALLRLVRNSGLGAVVDLGAGDGELLRQLHTAEPDVELVGVELRSRPTNLHRSIGWRDTLPDGIEGLLVANELLDNIPCDVVERDPAGRLRQVEVQPGTGSERLGPEVSDQAAQWVDRWWPLAEPGQRAEVGVTRDETWVAACGHVRDGVCIAVDFGHVRENRPMAATLSSYRSGRQTPLTLDGTCDITAAVAVDAVAAAVDGALTRQRDVLQGLGVSGSRPAHRLASSDPSAYVRALASASSAVELTDVAGLGGHYWVTTQRHPQPSVAVTPSRYQAEEPACEHGWRD